MQAVSEAGLLASLKMLDFNVGFARAVLEGKVDGSVWTSGSAGLGAAHVVHSYGMSLVWGDRVDDAFEEIVERLLAAEYRRVDEWLQIDPRWAHLPWRERLFPDMSERGRFQPPARVVDARINFRFDPEVFGSRRDSLRIPAGWSIAQASSDDFSRPGSVVPSKFWRSAEDFFSHGGGWRIERYDVFGALAFSSFRFDNEIELGIETAPGQRRQGLAGAVAAHMVQNVLRQGLTPVWACREGNLGSLKLALALGFVPNRRLDYFRLESWRDSPVPTGL